MASRPVAGHPVQLPESIGDFTLNVPVNFSGIKPAKISP
jgi:hypothetical protein